MKALRTHTWLLLAVAAGLGLRLLFATIKAGMYYPDEVFQYLEPAYLRIHGFGWLVWELERGLRNWVLPGYYGALLEIGELLGLRGWGLHRFLAYHNAVAMVALVPLGFKLGRAAGGGDDRLGLLAAWAMALFPIFSYLAPHTLSENVGMLAVTWAYALWLEIACGAVTDGPATRRRALYLGLLLGVAFCMRYTLLLFLPLVFLDLLLQRRLGAAAWGVVGFAAVVLALGALDRLTWGSAFHSLTEYVEYQLVEQQGRAFGESPASFYLLRVMLGRFGLGAIVLALAMLAVARRQWRLIAAWVVPLAVLSAVPHKEERFLLPMWPFFLTAGLAGLLAIWRRWSGIRSLSRVPAAPIVLGALWLSAFMGVKALPMRLSAGVFRAQSWVGEQGDATGLLVDGETWGVGDDQGWLEGDYAPWWHGGYLLLGRNIPMAQYDEVYLSHRAFNYVILGNQRRAASLEENPDFEPLGRFEGGVTVFRRRE